jgi:hypothetical protein
LGPGYRLDNRISGFRFPAGKKIFLFSIASRPAVDPTHSPVQWVPRTFSSGFKCKAREGDDSPPSSSEGKDGGAIPPQE